VTDRQTDGRTDSLIAYAALHYTEASLFSGSAAPAVVVACEISKGERLRAMYNIQLVHQHVAVVDVTVKEDG